jgi:hypothetical protein
MWGLIKNSLENVKRRMKVPGYDFGEMKMFETEDGVTQRAPESPVFVDQHCCLRTMLQ